MKSSDSDETLDSLEKDIEHEQDKRDDETTESIVEKREKSSPNGTPEENGSGSLYFKQNNHIKDNHDIHSILRYSMSENGNDDERSQTPYHKKKQQSSSEDNKTFIPFNNLLSSKNDEDLQNMLNGNISEVSTDTKSFKEKLIMFEKLGK